MLTRIVKLRLDVLYSHPGTSTMFFDTRGDNVYCIDGYGDEYTISEKKYSNGYFKKYPICIIPVVNLTTLGNIFVAACGIKKESVFFETEDEKDSEIKNILEKERSAMMTITVKTNPESLFSDGDYDLKTSACNFGSLVASAIKDWMHNNRPNTAFTIETKLDILSDIEVICDSYDDMVELPDIFNELSAEIYDRDFDLWSESIRS